MAIYSYINSGITFNTINSVPNPKKEIPGKLVSNQNDFEYATEDGIKPVVNAVEIDWNGAQLSYVSLPNILDNGNTINTTGQLLALINDLQEQINAIVYIMNNGSSTTTSTTSTSTLPPIEHGYLILISNVNTTVNVDSESINITKDMLTQINVEVGKSVTIVAQDVSGYTFDGFYDNANLNNPLSKNNSLDYTIPSTGEFKIWLNYTENKPGPTPTPDITTTTSTTTTSTSTLPPSNPTQLTISVGKQNVQVTVDGAYITGGHTMPVNVGQQVIIRAYSSNNTSIGFYNINDLINPITENVSIDGNTYTLSYIIKSTGEHHIVIK